MLFRSQKRIKRINYFDVPDLSKMIPDIEYYALPILELPSMERFYIFFDNQIANIPKISLSRLNKKQLVPQSFTYSESDVKYHFGPTWYIVPAIMLPITSYFISLSEIQKLIQDDQIEKIIIDLSLQSYTDQPNIILTFFAKNGRIYLVEARYDDKTNQMFPPINVKFPLNN